MSHGHTSSQTVGPFFSIGVERMHRDIICDPSSATADTFSVRGILRDGDGRPVSDAFLELWQADAEGHYASEQTGNKGYTHGLFTGFGRVATDELGAFQFTTTKPGQVPFIDGRLQAPHVTVTIFMRGLLRHLMTRIYFPGEASNLTDPVLQLVPESRRKTLIAYPTEEIGKLKWDVQLQSEDETVFFEY